MHTVKSVENVHAKHFIFYFIYGLWHPLIVKTFSFLFSSNCMSYSWKKLGECARDRDRMKWKRLISLVWQSTKCMNEWMSRHLNRENSLSGRSGERVSRNSKNKTKMSIYKFNTKAKFNEKKQDKEIDNGWTVGCFLWFVVLTVHFLGCCCCSSFFSYFLSNSRSKTKQQQLMRHILCMCLCINNETLLAYETHFFLSRFVNWFHFWYFGCVKTKTLDILYGSEEAQFKSMSMSHKNVWI